MDHVRRALVLLPALAVVLGAAWETLAGQPQVPHEPDDEVVARSASTTIEPPCPLTDASDL